MKHSDPKNTHTAKALALLIAAAAAFFVYAGILYADPIDNFIDPHVADTFITPDTWNNSYNSTIDVQDDHTFSSSGSSATDTEDAVKDLPVIFYQNNCDIEVAGSSYDGGSATAIPPVSPTNQTCFASFDFEGLGFAIIGTTATDEGWIDVFVDGAKVNNQPVSFRDVATKHQVAVFGKSYNRINKHTVRLVVKKNYDDDNVTANDKVLLDRLDIRVSNDRPVGVDRMLIPDGSNLYATGHYLKYPRINGSNVVYEYHLLGGEFDHDQGAGCDNLADHKVEIVQTSLGSNLNHDLDTISLLTPPDRLSNPIHLHNVNRLPVVSPNLTVWHSGGNDTSLNKCNSDIQFVKSTTGNYSSYDVRPQVQSNMSVDGWKIAYQRNDGLDGGTNWNIYYVDIDKAKSNNVALPVATGDRWQETQAAISGNRVAWVRDNGRTRNVFVKDVNDDDVVSMDTIGCNQSEPAIFQDIVVWTEEDCDEPPHPDPTQDYNEDGKVDTNIIMAQLNSATTRVVKRATVDDDESNAFHPKVSGVGGRVIIVWEDWRNDRDGKWSVDLGGAQTNDDNPDIFGAVYRKSTGSWEREIQITQDNVPEINPDVNGKNVVFEKVDLAWVDFGETLSALDCTVPPDAEDVQNFTKRCYYPNSIYMKDLASIVNN